MSNRKEYYKAYYQKHKEELKAKTKAYREDNKEQHKEYMKAWRDSHKESMKAWNEAHKEQRKEYQKEYQKEYRKVDINSFKNNIRNKSNRVLKQMNLHIDGYEVHHCFGYEDPNKFIYISKSLHLKIHKLLRENNIPADSNHWLAIRELVNNADEFTYIKC